MSRRINTQWALTICICALVRLRHSVNSEQPMVVPETTETIEATMDIELYTPGTVEYIDFESPRKKTKVMEGKNSNASSSMPEINQHVRCSIFES